MSPPQVRGALVEHQFNFDGPPVGLERGRTETQLASPIEIYYQQQGEVRAVAGIFNDLLHRREVRCAGNGRTRRVGGPFARIIDERVMDPVPSAERVKNG